MNFTIERREVEIESTFSPRLWHLVHDVPVLYEALLDRLDNVGLSGTDLRPEAGDGSVGGAGLAFWLMGGRVHVQLRLDSLRLRTAALTADVRAAADGVVAALQQASRKALRFRTHTLSHACHGRIEGMKAAEFVGRIVPKPPIVEGLGDLLGTGVAYYFGEAPPTVSSTLTLDTSQVIQDGLFVRFFVVMDGAAGTIPEVHALAEKQVRTTLASVSLETT